MHSRVSMSFTEKRISVNAVVAFVLGIVLNLSHIGMMIFSVMKKGNVPFSGGVIESYIMLFSIFGLLWGVLSLDDEKTVGRFKIHGIVLNGISLVISLLIMAWGVLYYLG